MALDLGTVGYGLPGLELGTKLAVVQDRTFQLAGQVHSDIPLDGDIWKGEVGGLASLSKGGLELRTDVAWPSKVGGIYGGRACRLWAGASARWAGSSTPQSMYGGGSRLRRL